MDHETRTWQRLAILASATIGLLIARVWRGRPLATNWLGETPEQVIERRLAACEAHLQDLEERLHGNAQHR